jgi:hypothetical protein
LVWESFPQRIIGFQSKDYYFNEDLNRFELTSKWVNSYSIIDLSKGSIYHKYYNFLFQKYYDQNFNQCEDLFQGIN